MAEDVLSSKLRDLINYVTVIPTPESIFGAQVPKEVIEEYRNLRMCYDRYVVACIHHETMGLNTRFGFEQGEKKQKPRDAMELPQVKEVLPGHVAKDFRKEDEQK